MRWISLSRLGIICAILSALSGVSYLFVWVVFFIGLDEPPVLGQVLLVPSGLLLLSPAFAAGLIYAIHREALSLPPQSNHLLNIPLLVVLVFILYLALGALLQPIVKIPGNRIAILSFAHFSYVFLLFLSIIVLHLELEQRGADH